MELSSGHDFAVRYRGFLLLPQGNNTWLVRPERSPMSSLLPFRAKANSLDEVKAILRFRLSKEEYKNNSSQIDQAA